MTNTKTATDLNAKLTVAKSTQTAIPELNRTEKTMYYLVIQAQDKTYSINVGEKTFNEVNKMIGGNK